MKAIESKENLNQFLSEYNYQPKLTQKLDCLDNVFITQQILNEIVLWKVNRYIELNEEILRALDKIKALDLKEHRQAENVLKMLLYTDGVYLPMASTFLRFRNPKVFQIIDKHAYRAITDKKYPLYTSSPIERKISLYFNYIDELWKLCEKRNLEFNTIDRLLYIFDKRFNGKL